MKKGIQTIIGPIIGIALASTIAWIILREIWNQYSTIIITIIAVLAIALIAFIIYQIWRNKHQYDK